MEVEELPVKVLALMVTVAVLAKRNTPPCVALLFVNVLEPTAIDEVLPA